jgi:hypothetical protein
MPKNALYEKKLKEMILSAQQNLQELAIQRDKLDREYQRLCEELDSTPEDLKNHAEDSDNYTQPIWEFLNNEKQNLETRYSADLNSIRDVKKLKKTFSENQFIQPHWIHVR